MDQLISLLLKFKGAAPRSFVLNRQGRLLLSDRDTEDGHESGGLVVRQKELNLIGLSRTTSSKGATYINVNLRQSEELVYSHLTTLVSVLSS